jgi:hypothetical protein
VVGVVAACPATAAVALAAHRDGLASGAGVRAAATCLLVSLTAVLISAVSVGFRRRGEFDLLRSSR